MLSFQLTMPNVGSWNGKWTGERQLYYETRKAKKERENELDGEDFYYNFGKFLSKIDSTVFNLE